MQRIFLGLVVALLGCRAMPAILTGESAKDYINRGNAVAGQGRAGQGHRRLHRGHPDRSQGRRRLFRSRSRLAK